MSLLVSINCITYNHEKYIGKALDSFLMQETDFDFEILIYDDASTDSTREIIEKYQKQYPNIIKPIFQKENQFSKGISRLAYRYNHTRAKGEYIALCEGDDYWVDKHKLKKQVAYMNKNPECTMSFHNAEKLNDINKRIEGTMIDSKVSNKKFDITEILDIGFIPTASVIYRKSALDNPPNWFMEAVVGDLPTELITTSKGYAYYFNEVMSIYRVCNTQSMMNQWILKQKKVNDKIKHIKSYIDIIDGINKLSNFEYDNYLQDKKNKYEFEIQSLKGNIKVMKSEKYSKYYKTLNWKSKVAIYLRKYIPNIYINFKILIFKFKIFIEKKRSFYGK